MLINYTTKELSLLARIMRAEAQTEGELGMLMVGNVVINRCLVSCYTFKNIRTISDAIYQKNQFSGINSNIFNSSPTKKEKDMAKRLLMGETFHPAEHSLWFYAPKGNDPCMSTWYDQKFAGSYKNHCFYKPDNAICKEIY